MVTLVRCRRHHHHTLPPSRQRRQSVMAVSTMPCASADRRTLQQSGHTTAMSEQGRAGDAREMHAGLIGQCVGCGCNVGRCGCLHWMRIMEVPLPRRRRVTGAARPKRISFSGGGPCRHDEAGQADDLLLCERLHSPVTHQRRVSHELYARRVAEEPADFCSG